MICIFVSTVARHHVIAFIRCQTLSYILTSFQLPNIKQWHTPEPIFETDAFVICVLFLFSFTGEMESIHSVWSVLWCQTSSGLHKRQIKAVGHDGRCIGLSLCKLIMSQVKEEKKTVFQYYLI